MSTPRLLAALLSALLPLLPDGRPAAAQPSEAPRFETRAVWLATVLSDGGWPVPGAPAAEQEAALRTLIRDIHTQGVNTLVFQAVGRGDAMYRSALLPWSPRLQGPGVDPGFDPLAVAVEASHALGMALHAWVNVYRAGDALTPVYFDGTEDPAHVLNAHPDWVRAVDANYWINPASDSARAWLVDVVVEIVENYDIDGIHYDYIRYPQGGLDDDEATHGFNARGFENINDWRRNNVSRFVEEAYKAITAVKPWLHVGASPIGNYRPSVHWSGLWGYDDVYQASRDWLRNGWLDYAAPQIYFSTGTAPEAGSGAPSPDFTVLAEEWVDESEGRPIWAGIAAYKAVEGVFGADDLPDQIQIARDVGAAGHIYFRYDHFAALTDYITPAYSFPALPAPMAHRLEAVPPAPPDALTLDDLTGHSATLTWTPAAASERDPLFGYAVYRSLDGTGAGLPQHLRAVVSAGRHTFTDTLGTPHTGPLAYAVVALSRLGMASEPATVAIQSAPAYADEGADYPVQARLTGLFPNPVARATTVAFELPTTGRATIIVYDVLGRERLRLLDAERAPGRYEIDLDAAGLPPGTYLVTLHIGGRRSTRPMMVTR